MDKKELTRRIEQADRLARLGFSLEEAEQIRRISCTLSRWCEMECNEDVRRHEEGPRKGKVFIVRHIQGWDGKYRETRCPIQDRETGAIKRMNKIIAAHPGLAWYYQGDPRGAAVHVYSVDKLEGRDIDSVYSLIGIAVW